MYIYCMKNKTGILVLQSLYMSPIYTGLSRPNIISVRINSSIIETHETVLYSSLVVIKC